MREIDYKTLKVGDKVVTRSGRDGRVICTNRDSGYPVVCLITILNKSGGGFEDIQSYSETGKTGFHTLSDFGVASDGDIFLPPQKEYINLYRNEYGVYHSGCAHKSLDEAEQGIRGNWNFIKTIEVEL